MVCGVMLAGVAACSSSDDASPEPEASTSTLTSSSVPDRVDTLIQGGTIYNGEDLEPITGDVGVVDDRIVFVGEAPSETEAGQVIDASGMVVAPGFIDAHTHVDGDVFSDDAEQRLNLPFTTQGVTTAVIGNDGYGEYAIADQAEQLEAKPPGTNVAMFVGFGPVRQSQLGDTDAAPDAEQLRTMKDLVAGAMCEGAIGLSTGLYYTPQNFSTTEEVVELARVAAEHGGVYDSHISGRTEPRRSPPGDR